MSHKSNDRVAEAQKEREDELDAIKQQNEEMLHEEMLPKYVLIKLYDWRQ